MNNEKPIETGDIISLKNRNLKVGDLISNGVSAFVFKAQFEDGNKEYVAVKASRKDTVDAYRSEFGKEAGYLQELPRKLALHGNYLANIIPAYIDGVVDGEYPYLVEEFIDGPDLVEAVRSLSAGTFDEAVALYLANLIGNLLVVMHEDMEITYRDMKMKNFHIVNRSASLPKPELKVLDWNLLGTLTPANIQKDLLFASYYLFFMITGVSSKIDENNLQVESELVKFIETANMSVGMREFLKNNFQTDVSKRCQTAKAWLEEVQQLDEFWQTDASQLFQKAMLLRGDLIMEDTFNKMDGPDKSTAALAAADIARIKGSPDAGQLLNELKRELSVDGIIGRLEEHLLKEPPDQTSAARLCQNTLSKIRYKTNPKLVLWGRVVTALPIVTTAADTKTLIEAIRARCAQDFKIAQAGFQKFPGSSSLHDLYKETSIQVELDECKKINIGGLESLAGLEGKYNSLKSKIAGLPDDIRTACFGEDYIEPLVEEIHRNRSILNQALSKLEFQDADTEIVKVQKTMQALVETPYRYRAPVVEKIVANIQEEINRGNYSLAESLASLDRQDDKIKLERLHASNLRLLTERCEQYGTGSALSLRAIIEFLKKKPAIPEIETSFHTFLMDNWEDYEWKSPKLPAELVKTFRSANNDQDPYDLAEKLDEKLWDRVREYSNGLLGGYPTEILNNVLLWLDYFTHQREDVNQLKTAIETELVKRKNEIDNNAQHINKLNEKIKTASVSIHAIKSLENTFDAETLEKLQSQKQHDAMVILNAINEISRLDKTYDADMKLNWLADLLDLNSRMTLALRANFMLVNDEAFLKKHFDTAINANKLEEAEQLLVLLESGKNQDNGFRQRFNNIKEFLNWSQLPTLSEVEFTNWEKSDIPLPYWGIKNDQGFSPRDYADQQVNEILDNFKYEKLPELINWRRHYQFASGAPRPQTNLIPKDSLKRAAQDLDTDTQSEEKKTGLVDLIDRYPNPVREDLSVRPGNSYSATPTPVPDTQASHQGSQLDQDLLGKSSELAGKPAQPNWFRKQWDIFNGWELWKKIGIGIGVVVIFIVIGFGIPFVFSYFNQGNQPAQPPVIAAATASPEAVLTPRPGTPVPTHKPAETPLPTSKYSYVDEKPSLYNTPPALPVDVTPMYLIDARSPADALFVGTGWNPQPVAGSVIADGINNLMQYFIGDGTAHPDQYVEWKMDKPVGRDGLYAFYINDPLLTSGSTSPVPYKVYVDDPQKPLQPVYGQDSIKQLTNKEQQTPEWRCIGFYELRADQLPVVRLEVPGLGTSDILGADAVLIAYRPNFPDSYSPLANIQLEISKTGEQLIYWADDTLATPEPAVKDNNWTTSDPAPNPDTWNGVNSIETRKGTPYSVTWASPERLNQGTYDLWVFIPQELTVPVKFSITDDSKTPDAKNFALTKVNYSSSDLKASYGKFISIGQVTIPAGQSNHIYVKMAANPDKDGEMFAYDVLLIASLPGQTTAPVTPTISPTITIIAPTLSTPLPSTLAPTLTVTITQTRMPTATNNPGETPSKTPKPGLKK